MSSAPQRKPRRQTARQQLDERRVREADLRPHHIVRPGPGFGVWTVHDTLTSAEKVVAAPMVDRSFKPGSTVLVGSYSGQGGESIVAAAPVGRIGAAEFTFPAAAGAERDAVGIVSADPDTLPAGASETPVDFEGFGLRATDTYRAVEYNTATKTWDDDTLITLGTPTWTSATAVSMPVSVSATAPAGHEIRLEVSRA